MKISNKLKKVGVILIIIAVLGGSYGLGFFAGRNNSILKKSSPCRIKSANKISAWLKVVSDE